MVLFIGFLTVVFNRIADMAIENGMLQVPDEVDVGGVAVGFIAPEQPISSTNITCFSTLCSFW